MLIRTIVVLFWGLLVSPVLAAGTLDEVQARGYLKCAVQAGHVGFASPDVYGQWRGFDVDFCRAVAAAVLGDPERVMFVSTDRSVGIDSLATGSADLVARAPVGLGALGGQGARSPGMLLHDSYGFLARSHVRDVGALANATVCALDLDGALESVGPYLESTHPSVEILRVLLLSHAREKYQGGGCAAVAALRSDLAGIRARMDAPAQHHLIEVEVGKAPSGPRVRGDDDGWAKVVRWVLFALIEAEELGIESGNVAKLREAPGSARIGALLGAHGELGAGLGLPNDWAVQILQQVGNYAEIYARNIGPGTDLDLPRTRSQLWTKGGLLFAPPARGG